MKKNVLVTIKGTQINDLGEADTMELFTEGLLFIRPDSYYIVYNESAMSGMEGSTTSLRIQTDKVVLNRMGKAEMKQTFELGKLDEGMYVTPQGAIHLGIIPSRVHVDFGETGGAINLEYELQIGQQTVCNNSLLITVKEDRYS
ncbi:DUF1934 domain-containing protein [Heliophilum fasciatum]|uniref:Uncharacterized beta-barrel protein YwiB (DUF1934 family) n=1 Tax=Heliophilum fasciatum TaxID=35700 RepID=A0A4R2RMI8_9FIRM|nr:DUF1934 domain-containing protein [Heliophilum fasciatum]MCW2277509.1 uncharacterized beta-barrel protein YwiB (DUF1934 family) [Heliophilum fasciatum]TCP65200.1 uncharacterized beta-barrel protein YwiB (DUF1934 family) [Heliophilum fasciatum]